MKPGLVFPVQVIPQGPVFDRLDQPATPGGAEPTGRGRQQAAHDGRLQKSAAWDLGKHGTWVVRLVASWVQLSSHGDSSHSIGRRSA